MKQQKTNNWQIKKLGEVCEVITGTTPSKKDEENYGSDLPFCKPPHLWDNEISFTIEEMLSYKGAKKARVVPPNTVLVTCIGNLGRTGFLKKEAAFNQQINAILENDKLIGKYIFYQAQSPSFRNQLEKLATGTTVSIVNKKNFETIEIPLPPLETQHAIVSKIEELFSELDKGIAELKTAQQQLKTYRQSVLKSAFEGKLTNENVKDGELPDGWEIIKVIDVALKVTDGEHSTPRRTDNGYFLLSARNIQNGFLALDNVDYIPEDEYNRIIKRCNPEEGDILISCSGSVGRICRVPKNIEFGMVRSVALLKLDWEKFSSKYFEFLFQSPYLQKQIEKGKKATAQANLFLGPIKNLDLIIPSLKEQHRIVQEIESRLSVADKMEQSIQESLQKAEALRQSILKKAFSGELV
jgi:type I restriction enzyme S subunit